MVNINLSKYSTKNSIKSLPTCYRQNNYPSLLLILISIRLLIFLYSLLMNSMCIFFFECQFVQNYYQKFYAQIFLNIHYYNLSKIHQPGSMYSFIQNYKSFRKALLLKTGFSFSPSTKSNLQVLYEMSSKSKTPFFTIQSHLIQIIEDPLDFYYALYRQSNNAIYRVGLSSLYLGTGSLQRFFLKNLVKRVKDVSTLQVKMVYDYNRSLRFQKGQSPSDMMNYYIENDIKDRVNVSLVKQSKVGNKILGEVAGVHHQKIAIFDNNIIIGGANLSHNYFLNRRDRYMKFKQCSDLADYLYDYIQILQENSEQIGGETRTSQNLQQHYKIWKYEYSPREYKQDLASQQIQLETNKKAKQAESVRKIVKQNRIEKQRNRNITISEQLGSDLKQFEGLNKQQAQMTRDSVRDRFYNIADENDVGNCLMQLEAANSREEVIQVGEKVYIFPFIQDKKLKEELETEVLLQILKNSLSNNIKIRISSGYLNLTKQILQVLGKSTIPTQILCSAPEANSFYRGGLFKQFIPYFYRNFEGMLLSAYPNKFEIKQYFDNKWSFHAKGIWIEENDNNYLTVLGSSNYNRRSKQRDSELQLYLYSTCEKFNKRLNKQWKKLEKDCKEVSLKQIESDEEIKYNKIFNWLSKMFSKFL